MTEIELTKADKSKITKAGSLELIEGVRKLIAREEQIDREDVDPKDILLFLQETTLIISQMEDLGVNEFYLKRNVGNLKQNAIRLIEIEAKAVKLISAVKFYFAAEKGIPPKKVKRSQILRFVKRKKMLKEMKKFGIETSEVLGQTSAKQVQKKATDILEGKRKI